MDARIQQCLQEVEPLIASGDWRNAYETVARKNRKRADEKLERALIDIILRAADPVGTIEMA